VNRITAQNMSVRQPQLATGVLKWQNDKEALESDP
jgi:hypothetical protein